MCGITGLWHLDGRTVPSSPMMQMVSTIEHRGPDDEGYLFLNTATSCYEERRGQDTVTKLRMLDVQRPTNEQYDLAFGFRRLSIIDCSSAGHQPMANEDGSLWIVHNGEVYNYIELRRELRQKGYSFRTDTDTEVILNAYAEWGEDCLRRFNGMWAFCIWDSRKKQLFCARDRFGIKPFHYYFDRKNFVFASEIKALLAHPSIPRRVNDAMVYDYLTLGRPDYSEGTFFAGIKQLRPSHYLTLDKNGKLAIHKWWDVQVNTALGELTDKEDGEYAQQFLELLEDSIRLRLRSDVPVGTCLSGGLDSSSVVCLANELMLDDNIVDRRLIGEQQKTFSSCFEDQRFDERRFIEKVLKQTGAERNYVFSDGENKLWEELPRLVWHQEEPFGSTSIYAQWNVMRKAKEGGVTVLLDGQGGDELLAGYHSYYSVYLAQVFRAAQILSVLREAKAASAITGERCGYLLARALYSALPFPAQFFARNMRNVFLGSQESNALRALNPAFRQQFADRRKAILEEQRHLLINLPQRLYADVFINSLPALLRYEDRNSMAFSLEARVPFLDHRLVEFIFSLPARCRVNKGWTKWILRNAVKGVIPEEIRWRRDKMGFVTPEVTWLRKARGRIMSLFEDEPLSCQYVDPRIIVEELDALLDRDVFGITEIWRWINLEIWLRVYFSEGACK